MNEVSPGQPKSLRPSSRLVLFACLLGFVWLIFLGLLAFRTANPATINWKQIAAADAVIVAEVVDAKLGKLKVQSIPFQPPPPHLLEAEQSLMIPVHDTEWDNQQRRILPLKQSESAAGEWQIFPAPLPGQPLLDYPADPDFLSQLNNFDKTKFLLQWQQLDQMAED